MDDAVIAGRLAEVPFPRVIAGIWKKGLTGHLRIMGPGGEKTFAFEKGSLAVDRSILREKDFLESLLTSGVLDLISLDRCEDHARMHGTSALRSLLEIPLLAPEGLWALLETFVKDEAFLLFGTTEGDYAFEPRPMLTGPLLIRGIPVPALVMEGTRRMPDPAVVAGHLPDENESLQVISLYLPDVTELAPHEAYILDSLDGAKTLADLIDESDLGKKEVQRILFAFLCLGLAGTRSSRRKSGKTSGELASDEMERLFKVFNDKCSYIFKYISKEIGPVGSSVIEKAVGDVKGQLDPAFQEFALTADGRFELKSQARLNLSFLAEETRKSLLRGMDEILAAEVLAVKRTLGPGHESALVRNLEKIGEPP